MRRGLSESEFYMWRAVFALAHADHKVTDEEVRFMAEVLEDIPFSDVQKAILSKDIVEPQDVKLMFSGIQEPKDKAVFFKYARELCHIDGEYGIEEQDVMLELSERYMSGADIEDLIGQISLEFDDEYLSRMDKEAGEASAVNDYFQKTIFSFKDWFKKK